VLLSLPSKRDAFFLARDGFGALSSEHTNRGNKIAASEVVAMLVTLQKPPFLGLSGFVSATCTPDYLL
jgi:hypothetical protein